MKQQKEEDTFELIHQVKKMMQGLKCDNHHPITMVCHNQNCEYPALRCFSRECQDCHNAHQQCRFLSFQTLTKIIQKKTDARLSEFIDEMERIEKEFVQKIMKTKRRICFDYPLDRLKQILGPFYYQISELYDRNNHKALKGKEAASLLQLLDRTSLEEDSDEVFWIQHFRKTSNKLLDEYITTRNQIIDREMGRHTFRRNLQKKQPVLKIDSNVLETRRMEMKLKELIAHPDKRIQRYVSVLSQQLEKIDNEMLSQHLNKPKTFELAFRASNFQFKAQSFHHTCNDIEGSLVLAQTEFGKIIGGFTPLSWDGNGFKKDQTGRSFLFSPNLAQKMTLINSHHSIYCSPNLGPTFGGEQSFFGNTYDFSLSDQCNSSNSSRFVMPKCYAASGKSDFLKKVIGLAQGGSFKVTEYEVYKVIYA